MLKKRKFYVVTKMLEKSTQENKFKQDTYCLNFIRNIVQFQ